MSETTAADYHRRDDERWERVMAILTEQGLKIDKTVEGIHAMELHMATQDVADRGKMDAISYRVDQIEGRYQSVVKVVIGLVVSFLTGAIALFWQFVAGHGGGK